MRQNVKSFFKLMIFYWHEYYLKMMFTRARRPKDIHINRQVAVMRAGFGQEEKEHIALVQERSE